MGTEISRFEFRGLHGRMAACGLRRFDLSDGRVVIIATELDDNPGVSVTNFAEELATIVCQTLKIDPQKLVWIEHYPPEKCPVCRGPDRRREPTYDLVTFEKTRTGVFDDPVWRPMQEQVWTELGIVPE